MSDPTYHAVLTKTPPLNVNEFPGFQGTEAQTPGDVGVCLSGGGSRAMCAGMGQLRALKHLQANGKSLLSQVKAISTVSGGSWLGVTYEFLKGDVTDDDFLNLYVPNPGDLVPSNGPSIAVTLDKLPKGNIGQSCADPSFNIVSLAFEAYSLSTSGTPDDMLWQVLMGIHILEPYGLYHGGDKELPTSYFTLNGQTHEEIVSANQSLKNVTAHLFADATDNHRTRRPYLICNTAMFVDLADGTELLAPVQAGAIFTGIVAQGAGTDANGKTVGGGGVTSFAFNSALLEVDGLQVEVSQPRQWSLTDIIGASSAAFAESIQKYFGNPELFHQEMVDVAPDVGEKIKSRIAKAHPEIDESIAAPHLDSLEQDLAEFDPAALIPAYDYWPVLNATPDPTPKKTRFADGGSLENTGIAGMLSYGDIRSIIAFVNSSTPLQFAAKGIMLNGQEVPGTRIRIASQIPPLFGYQPYDSDKGYVPYSDGGATKDALTKSKNKVFDPARFPELLKGLWSASGNGGNVAPASFKQTELHTQHNEWFGVAGGKVVDVLWVYLNPVQAWVDLLSPDVQTLVDDTNNFPNYDTIFQLQLSETEVNLLASLTAWCVGGEWNATEFKSLFSAGPLA